MNSSSADIIFFAIVAVYLGIKLFSILGKKNEQDTNPEQNRAKIILPELVIERAETPESPIIMEEKNKLENFVFTDDAAKAGIREIIERDNSFALEPFVEGAKIALEMLMNAFSSGDKKQLKQLLDEDVYKILEQQIDEASKQNIVNIKTLVAIEKVEIEAAYLSGSRARIKLKFLTEQVNATKDSNGNIISGNPKTIETVEDTIEFERNIRSGNPNWSITSL